MGVGIGLIAAVLLVCATVMLALRVWAISGMTQDPEMPVYDGPPGNLTGGEAAQAGATRPGDALSEDELMAWEELTQVSWVIPPKIR